MIPIALTVPRINCKKGTFVLTPPWEDPAFIKNGMITIRLKNALKKKFEMHENHFLNILLELPLL